ncbi:hypothetical protein GOV06_02025, partial [Candidatus Woesearchaeota archaeon]|nr:hypothetical protein [Candidatus Woesearchaeota archaeon]
EFSNRQVLLDSEIYLIKSLNTKFNDSNTTFYSRNLKTTRSILDKYNIRYIWIDPKMKQGQVWTREEQGILFLFRNSETFKKLYSKDDIEIWEYLG